MGQLRLSSGLEASQMGCKSRSGSQSAGANEIRMSAGIWAGSSQDVLRVAPASPDIRREYYFEWIPKQEFRLISWLDVPKWTASRFLGTRLQAPMLFWRVWSTGMAPGGCKGDPRVLPEGLSRCSQEAAHEVTWTQDGSR